MSDNAARILSLRSVKECVILERINRFVVKIISDRAVRKAYVNNTGRLLNHIVEGRRGFCVKHQRRMKTDCRLFAVREKSLAAVIDTQLQIQVLEKAIAMDLLPWIRGSRIIRRNARLGSSLIDYLLEYNGEKIYLEVKSAVLRYGEYALYPDCLSLRGRKHIIELMNHVKSGGRGIILFIAALPDVKAFKPNVSADPEISDLLLESEDAGVIIRAVEMYYNPEDSYVYLSNPDLSVELA